MDRFDIAGDDDAATELMRDERYWNVWHAYHRSYVELVNEVLRATDPVAQRTDFHPSTY